MKKYFDLGNEFTKKLTVKEKKEKVKEKKTI